MISKFIKLVSVCSERHGSKQNLQFKVEFPSKTIIEILKLCYFTLEKQLLITFNSTSQFMSGGDPRGLDSVFNFRKVTRSAIFNSTLFSSCKTSDSSIFVVKRLQEWSHCWCLREIPELRPFSSRIFSQFSGLFVDRIGSGSWEVWKSNVTEYWRKLINFQIKIMSSDLLKSKYM